MGHLAVPFRIIPTTCGPGSGKSLPWIKQNKLENPRRSAGGGRMLLGGAVLPLGSFTTPRPEKADGKLAFGSAKWLWFGAHVFPLVHARHHRPPPAPVPGSHVPAFVTGIEGLDSILQVGLPLLYIMRR